MEFRTAICDECGTVRYWCDEITFEEKIEILGNHPEWYVRCV